MPAATTTGSPTAVLATLPVKGKAPMTGYGRARFGEAWADTDHNGCDTRDDVLARDLTGTVRRGCIVESGMLVDPYSGRMIPFRRGVATSTAVQIDHVSSLGNAWQTGAQGWDDAKRLAFANDLHNLLAVSGPLNMQKGDRDASAWVPPNRAEWCAYGTAQVQVKAAYGLWVTASERDALLRLLGTCP
jgi:hypothetical protein